MRTDDQADSCATRAPSPASLEAMALEGESAMGGSARARGVTLEEFERGLLRAGLLDPEGLREALVGLPAGDGPDGTEAVARALVRLGKLTRYQAAALFQGKGRALRIGPYVVLDKLGSGGMGLVFKARDRRGGPVVALKLLPPSASRRPQAVLRFRREARIMGRLDHPNVIAWRDIGSAHGVHYLVMDCVDGRDLDRVVRSGGPLKVARALDCVIQAAHGLLAAHERGIVHRDVKPANLLIDAKGVVRVLDLGLARITRGDGPGEGPDDGPSLTRSGIVMGTVDYLSPEQSDDSKRADHRADIYALGCTLHFLLTGRPPYSGDSILQRLVAHHRKPIPSLVEARPGVPPRLDAAFRSMLAKAPEGRPRSMAEVIEALEACRGLQAGPAGLRVFDDGGPPPAPPTPPPDPDPTGDTGACDLMTLVRDELFEPGPAPPLPPRRAARRRGRRRDLADLALRGLVAAAAMVVFVRFLPGSPPASPAPPTTTEAEAKAGPEVAPTAFEAPKVVAPPEPRAGPSPAPSPEVVGPPRPWPPPPPPRSLLEDLIGPPMGGSPPPRAGKPGPKPGRPGRPPGDAGKPFGGGPFPP